MRTFRIRRHRPNEGNAYSAAKCGLRCQLAPLDRSSHRREEGRQASHAANAWWRRDGGYVLILTELMFLKGHRKMALSFYFLYEPQENAR